MKSERSGLSRKTSIAAALALALVMLAVASAFAVGGGVIDAVTQQLSEASSAADDAPGADGSDISAANSTSSSETMPLSLAANSAAAQVSTQQELLDAIAAITSGNSGVIELTQDIDLTQKIHPNAGSSVTITSTSGNAYKITRQDGDADYADYYNNNRHFYIDNDSVTLTLQNIVLEGRDGWGGIYVDYSKDNTVVNLNEGAVIENCKYTWYTWGGGVNLVSGTLIMNGGIVRNNEATTTYEDASKAMGGGVFAQNAIVNINSGSIENNISSNSAGGLCAQYSTVNIADGTIKNNTAANGGGVYFDGGVTCTMTGGSIEQNNATYNYGGGVYVYTGWDGSSWRGSTFDFQGGSISNNSSVADRNTDIAYQGVSGVGVYTNGGDTYFNMSGGTISGNRNPESVQNTSSLGGGGIFADNYSHFTMTGGTVGGTSAADANASYKGGGIYGWSYAKINLNGGSISYNESCASSGSGYATTGGGGVYVQGSSEATINGAVIDNNTAPNGGGILVDGSTLMMQGATSKIKQNKATLNYGAGVYMKNGSTFTMNDGAIEENAGDSSWGADGIGIYARGSSSSRSTVTMSGGVIRANSNSSSSSDLTGDGGGIGVSAYTTFTMTGGIIGGDNASDANKADSGGGVASIEDWDDQNIIISISGGSIKNNIANSGGGICDKNGLECTTLNIAGNADVSYNQAIEETDGNHGSGGGLFLSGATFSLGDNASIHHNSAESHGGALYLNNVLTEIHGRANISENYVVSAEGAHEYSESMGGAGLIHASTVNTGGNSGDAVTITNNTAGNGGAFHVSNGAVLNVKEGATIANNKAYGSGGGIYLDYSGGTTASPTTFNMTGGSIDSNEADSASTDYCGGGGGGIFNFVVLGSEGAGPNCTKFEITGGSLTNNSAPNGDGGGIHCYTGHPNGSTLTPGNWESMTIASAVHFSGNTASSWCQPTQGDVDRYPAIATTSISLASMDPVSPLNNYDINFIATPSLRIVYDPNWAAWPALPNDGAPPVDPNLYAGGDRATILGNVGVNEGGAPWPLRLEGKSLAGWSLVQNPGDGDTVYLAGDILTVLASLANEDGNIYLYAVWSDKAPEPTIDKQVSTDGVTYKSADDAQIGDELSYQLSTHIPDFTGFDSYTFSIGDTTSKGLTLLDADNDGIVDLTADLVAYDNLGNERSRVSVLDKFAVVMTAEADSSTTFTITANDFLNDFKDHSGKKLFFSYKALLNEDAVIGSSGNPNSASVTYSNDPEDPGAPTTSAAVTAKVYTFKFMIDKIAGPTTDIVSAQRLAGAVFRLHASEDTSDHSLVQLVAIDDGTYRVATSDEIAAGGTVGEIITPQAEAYAGVDLGRVRILGLDGADYWLEETAAPEGYNKMSGLLRVSLAASYVAGGGDLDQWSVIYGNPAASAASDPDDGSSSRILVENKAGVILPITGGTGTVLLTIVGVLLIAFGIIWAVRRKRENPIEQ